MQVYEKRGKFLGISDTDLDNRFYYMYSKKSSARAASFFLSLDKELH